MAGRPSDLKDDALFEPSDGEAVLAIGQISGEPIRFMMSDGVELVGDYLGRDDAPLVLIFFHGAGQTRHAWRGTSSALAGDDRCVVRVDLRGHGESDWAKNGDYSLDRLAEDVRGVRRRFSGNAILVGASAGGISAILAAGEPPEAMIEGLVLVDIVARVDPDGADEVQRFMGSNPDGFESLEHAAESVAAYLPHRLRPPSPAGLERNLRFRADGRYHWHWDPLFMDARAVDAEERTSRVERAAHSLDRPVLLVRGGLSRIVNEEGLRHMAESLSQPTVVTVPEADHMVAGDSNDAFNRPLFQFIDAITSRNT